MIAGNQATKIISNKKSKGQFSYPCNLTINTMDPSGLGSFLAFSERNNNFLSVFWAEYIFFVNCGIRH